MRRNVVANLLVDQDLNHASKLAAVVPRNQLASLALQFVDVNARRKRRSNHADWQYKKRGKGSRRRRRGSRT